VSVTGTATAAGKARGSWTRRLPWAAGLVVVLACLGLQSQLYTGQERTVTTVFMFVTLAVAWNLIGGYTGYACFGQVGFFGLGAYTTVVLIVHGGLSFWVALPAAAVAAAVFAALIGLPLLRLKGHSCANSSPTSRAGPAGERASRSPPPATARRRRGSATTASTCSSSAWPWARRWSWR
jgi:branched-subunit amino acid transport system permease